MTSTERPLAEENNVEATAKPRAATTSRWGGPDLALAAAMLGFFVTALDAQIVNVALPEVGDALGVGVSGLQWVVTGYTLTYSALLLFAGTLSDRVGARRAYTAGMLLFVAASAACGLANTLGLLVAARLAQGAGAAVVAPTSLALIRENFADPAARSRAIAWWGVGGAVAAASGPVAGGLLTQVGWRLVFFVNLPIGAAALLVSTKVGSSSRRPAPFDFAGQASVAVSLAAFTFAIIEGDRLGWTSPTVLSLLAVTVLAAVVFGRAQTTGRHPMVPLHLLKPVPVRVALVVAFMTMAGFYGVVFVQSLYFQQLRGASPLVTGLLFVPMTGVLAVSQLAASRLSARLGHRQLLLGGLLVEALGLGLLAALPPSAPTWVAAAAMVPVGLGGAATLPSIVAVVLNHAPAELAGTASGVLNTCRQVGGSLGVAAIGAVLAAEHDFMRGLHIGLVANAVLLAGTAGLSLRLRETTAPRDAMAQKQSKTRS